MPKIIRTKISEASNAQLFRFASETLNLSAIKKGTNTANLIAAIANAQYDKDYIDLEEEIEQAPVPAVVIDAPAPVANSGAVEEPWITILIPKQELPGGGTAGAEAVPVQVNGRAMFIPRSVPAKIRYRYYLDICNAVQSLGRQDKETREITYETVPLYPHTVLKAPEPEHVEAWLKWDAESSTKAWIERQKKVA